MTVLELMSQVRRAGGRIWLAGDEVRLSAPSGVLSPVLRDQLRSHKREIRQLLQKLESDSKHKSMLSAPRPEGDLPISPAQERLWFLDRLQGDSSAYNVYGMFRLLGDLDVEVLRRALAEVVQRHEVLRTTFPERDGKPRQQIHPPDDWQLPVQDLRGLPADARDAALREFAEHEARHIFQLAEGPLLRTHLVQLAATEFAFLVCMHHIVADGWSIGVLMREVAALYTAFLQGEPSPLPPLPVQYADFSCWQRRCLAEGAFEQELEYWRQTLAAAPPLQLPTDRVRPATPSGRGAQHAFSLSVDLSNRLKSLGQRHDTTLFMTLLTAFETLLARYSNQVDFCIGTPIANRLSSDLEPLIGFFVNTQVLRADLAGNPRFTELLGKVRQATLDAYANQRIPFQCLLDALDVQRDASRTPLFQVMFALQNAPLKSVELPGIQCLNVPLESRTAKFDLTLQFTESAEGLSGEFEYASDLFQDTTIGKLAEHFQRLLAGMAEDPRRRIWDVPLLSETERRDITKGWNETKTSFPREASLGALFAEQAARHGSAVAVSGAGTELTYHELNARANQLAHYLQTLGVQAETRVAVCSERSCELIVAILGIVKAGAVYVPLDLSYPADRLRFMLLDSGATVLIQSGESELPLTVDGVRIVRLDQDPAAWHHCPETEPPTAADGNHLAYLMYTSGSTGVPKAIGIEHRSIARLVCQTDYVQLQPDDVVAQASNVSFDASTFEIWGALLNGARLAIVSRDVLLAPESFATALAENGCTALFLTTALFNQMAAECPEALGRLRHLMFGGQMVDPSRVRALLGRVPMQRLLHVYGPTETTTFASWHLVDAVAPAASTVPIGRPIANTTLYVLDRYGNPVPVGVIGEILIGGEGVARGYHNRPALTAERFVPDPFADRAGARLYRSGDLGRWRADGSLEILGRIDGQVKLRGFRVELGEIEAALSAIEGVRENVVVCRDEPHGEKRLVAYVVDEPGCDLSRGMLRDALTESLPAFMIPTAFVLLPSLPLTPNGKIDQRALPTPEVDLIENDFVPPRTDAERTLAEIWQQVLQLPRVGIHDNFFALGGDSILSIQIVARASRAGLGISAKGIFERQTIAELAEGISSEQPVEAEQGRVQGDVALTPIQHWFAELNPAEAHHFNQSVLLDVAADLSAPDLAVAWRGVVWQHDALRMRYHRDGSAWRQSHGETEDPALWQVVDLSHLEGQAQDQAFQAACARVQASLSLESGLVRGCLLELGAARGKRLLLVIHHLLVDGVSWRILLEDLQAACVQTRQRRQIELGPKTTAFRDWSRRLDEAASHGEFESAREYWERLAARTWQRLPVDHRNGPNTVAHAETVTLHLDPRRTDALLHAVGQAYRTNPGDLLLAALAQLVGQWANTENVWINLEGHGRDELFDDVDLSRTVGWFTALYPVCLQVVSGASGGPLLKSTKEQLRSVPDRGISHGVLRYLHPQAEIRESLDRLPRPEISFNYLGRFDQLASGESFFQPAAEDSGGQQSPLGERPHVLDVVALVTGQELQVQWHYSRHHYRRETMEALAGDFVKRVEQLVDHCLSPAAGGATPSDFPLVQLDQPTLDQLCKNHPDVESLYPLAPLQEGLAFHSLYEPDAGVYVEQLAFAVRQRVDGQAFDQAWQTVISRHPVMRCSLQWKNLDRPLLCVHKQIEFHPRKLDWSDASSEAEQDRRLEALFADNRRRGFDLARAPLMQLTAIDLPGNRQMFVWSFHHLLLDGWSLSVVLDEICRAYESLVRGQVVQLGEAGRYEAFLAWLQRQDAEESAAFWRSYLSGFVPAPPLQIGTPPAARADAPAEFPTCIARISQTTTRALEAFAALERLTLNSVIQAAWALLLSRYRGERDVVFGATVSGRPPSLEGIERTVGLFINTLPVRAQVDPAARFVDFAQQLQHQQVELRTHERTPLAAIRRWAEFPADGELFDNILVFENYPVDDVLRKSSFALSIDDVRYSGRTNYPLTAVVVPGEELTIRLTFDERKFSREASQRFLGQFATLVGAIATAADRQIRELPVASEAERQTLLQWNETRSPVCDDCLHQLVEAQAARTPDQPALEMDGTSLTFAELNARANRWARYLRSLGVGPETRVAFSLARSPELAIAILAICKSGGVCVPLDASYPRERLAYMLVDSGAQVLLTENASSDLAASGRAGLRHVPLADLAASGLAAENPQYSVDPDNLAYLLYTSGSTGRPKGVAMPHASLVNLMCWQNRHSQTGQLKTLQFAPTSFDVSFQEMFATWSSGRTLVLVSEEVRRDPWKLMTLIAERGVGRLFVPFVALEQLADVAITAGLSLPQGCEIITAGEQLRTTPAVRRLCQAAGATLENQYGPTEAHVVTAYRLANDIDRWEDLPPIGRPIANARIYVLDDLLEPVPLGATGDLYIGGLCLARGYFEQPGRTAAAFLPDPLSPQPGLRMYRSGDRARYRADGEVEFLGRADDQVKVRGYRVEPGEIEAVIAEHPRVRQTAVVTCSAANEQAQLVAYVVTDLGHGEADRALRAFLAARLPDYMIPAAVVVMADGLPLTPSGKLDRRALPPPESLAGRYGSGFVAPRTAIERMLADIFSDVLGGIEIGIHDDFFALGGHSLLATRAVSRIRESFQLEMQLRTLFEQPTVAGLAGIVTQAQRGDVASPRPPLVPLANHECLALSPAQQRLWFLQELDKQDAAYNIPAAFRLHGELHVERLRQAFEQVVTRHEVLRTVFRNQDGKPAPEVVGAVRWELDVETLEDSAEDRQRLAEARQLAEARRPFDLGRDLPFRTRLLRLSDREHVLLVTMHHIVSDAWSMAILAEEVSQAYGSPSAEKLAARPEPPVQPRLQNATQPPLQYSDFAAWQNQWLDDQQQRQSLEYWIQRLHQAPPLALPADRPRPRLRTFRGGRVEVRLGSQVSSEVGQLSRARSVTPFMTMLAAFQVLLHRYSGQADICVGTPIANRTHSELESLIGCFLNTLVLRVDLSGNPRFSSVLEQVRERALEAFAHQEVPFESIVEALGVGRDPSRTPLFQVAFTFQNAPPSTLELDGLQVCGLDPEAGTAKFDLALGIQDSDEGYQATFEYAADLFDARTVQRMADSFVQLVKAITSDCDQPIASLNVLSREQRAELYGASSAGDRSEAGQGCVHDVLALHAQTRPERVAVQFGEQTLTYEALNGLADRLARLLLEKGVQANSRVGVFAERGLNLVVALLGTIKAGAAYVPLDPSYPDQRLEFMLQDADVAVLLTESPLRDRLRAVAPVICLDRELPGQLSGQALPAGTPAQTAYVIYTSGSTGLPKGVEVSHENLTNLCRWHQRKFEVGPESRATQLAAIAFDAAVWELWPYLTAGASVRLVEPELVASPALLIDQLAAWQTTHCFAPTPLAEQLLELSWPAHTSLKYLLTGGDRLTRTASAQLPFQVINNYGPTEATVVTTSGDDLRLADPSRLPSIGQPIDHARVYLLDEWLEPVPSGAAGELFVGGRGVALGYLDRPALTAERFLPDPFSAVPGARMYRTGDRARWPGRDIEFLNRMDDQVKLRGYRIELGEIENAVSAHPQVSQSVVVIREFGNAEKQLVAYVVPDLKNPPKTRQLREHLKSRLPDYMLPAAFVVLDQLPLTPNGKVDRDGLPCPERVGQREFVPPRNQIEAQLAEIWCELLGVDRTGAGDNFFELGGHSLLATQLLSRIRLQLRADVPLRAIFETPTLGDLAEAVSGAAEESESAPIPVLPRDGHSPLSSAQRRLWFLEQLEPGLTAYTIPVELVLRGALDAGLLRQALTTVVSRHEVLRTVYVEVDGQPAQQILPAADVPLPVVDLSGHPTTERTAMLQQVSADQLRRPFDLGRDPVLRTVLVRLADDEHVLLVNIHHIAADGWSVSLLLREVTIVYGALATGRAAELPPLAIQYADFAAWHQDLIDGGALENEFAYWHQRLRGSVPLVLPTDRPRPAVQTYRGGHVAFKLSQALTEGVRQLSHAHEATTFMALLAAFKVLLRRYAGQNDISIGTPLANRLRPELEPLIGLFVNTLVIRTNLAGNPRFTDYLRDLRAAALEAYEHQSVPLERLVDDLDLPRDLSRSPLFQVMCSMQSQPAGEMEIPGLSVEVRPVDNGASRFDLTLDFSETPDGIAAAIEFNADLFDAATIERMIEQFQVLLADAVGQPDRRIGDLRLLPGDPGQQLREQEEATRRVFPSESCLHQLFEAQVARTPDAVALVHEGVSVTYGELNGRANQLANALLGRGAGPDALVGVCLERGPHMVASLLGVLKAGLAYVPLDPEFPRERLLMMTHDAEVACVITDRRSIGLLADSGAEMIVVDDLPPELPTGNLEIRARSEQLAYVIYTSGSTGRPKGVMISHRAMLNFLSSMRARPGLDAADVVLAVTSLSFDISVLEVFLPLLCGGRVIVAGRHAARDGAQLVELIRQHGVTLLQATPATWRLLLAAGWEGDNLRALCGGEALPVDLARAISERSGSLWNMYGPTETTVWSAIEPVGEALDEGVVPLGLPIDNTTLFVLDEHQRPQPPGVPGELWIGGQGLARGYLRRPALTAERFLPNPFSREAGSRMYRTGDLVRERAGRLEFLGRIDHQVKLRGHRIELGEIESVLREHPSIGDVVAAVHRHGTADPQLVAYVVSRNGVVTAGDLRTYLADKIPDYMLPSACVNLDRFPLTPNGKVDRGRLPAPSIERPPVGDSFVPPRNAVEEVLVELWREALGVEQIGVHDDFFALGGHSLTATQLISRIRATFRVQVPLLELFKAPTIAAVANLLDEHAMQTGHVAKVAATWLRLRSMSPDEREQLRARKRQADAGNGSAQP